MEISSHQDANVELKKGPWTREEDQKLLAYIEQHGHGSWRSLPAKAGLQRCGKSCRLRWTNYLRPDIKRGKFSTHEEKAIIRLHALLGNRWSAIAAHLPKRTDNEIKNYWNTRLKKRLARMGIDPTTHKPKNNGSAQSKHAANLSHMAQWETARLEAEARLARESKLLHILRINNNNINKPYCAAVAPPPPPPPKAPEQPQFLDVLKVWQANASNNNGFFSCGSSSSLESPTSTLNFSSSSGCYSGTNNHRENASERVEGKMGNSMQAVVNEENNAAAYGLYCEVTGLLDSVLVGTKHDGRSCNNDDESNNNNYYYHDMTANGVFVGDFEDTKNYWNELLNMVTTPLESPHLLI